jgi:hypothetical protein
MLYRKIEVPSKTCPGNIKIVPRYVNVETGNEAAPFENKILFCCVLCIKKRVTTLEET